MEYEPLYPAGFHDISHSDLENIFVKPFEENEKRKYLLGRFVDFMEKLREFELNVEVWLDGSFSTSKPEPGDIDILIIFDNDEINKLQIQQRTALTELFDRDLSKIRYSIDVLLLPSNDVNLRSYWRGWFGFSRSEQPKGIPRLYYGIN